MLGNSFLTAGTCFAHVFKTNPNSSSCKTLISKINLATNNASRIPISDRICWELNKKEPGSSFANWVVVLLRSRDTFSTHVVSASCWHVPNDLLDHVNPAWKSINHFSNLPSINCYQMANVTALTATLTRELANMWTARATCSRSFSSSCTE